MYTPINPGIFQAAYVGALAGMAASNRTPTDPLPADPVNTGVGTVAGAFAQSYDQAWGSTPSTSLDVQSTGLVCQAAWWGRAPQASVPANVNPATFTPLADALIAIVDAGDLYLAAQGITPLTLVDDWSDNVGGAPINLAPTGTVIASKTVTPRTTGVFDIWGSATFTTTGAPSAGLLSLGHDGTKDYNQGTGVTLENNNTARNDSINTVLGPFPLNVPVTLQLFGRAGGGGAQIPSDHCAQIMIKERAS
jgi:hypothetical protein